MGTPTRWRPPFLVLQRDGDRTGDDVNFLGTAGQDGNDNGISQGCIGDDGGANSITSELPQNQQTHRKEGLVEIALIQYPYLEKMVFSILIFHFHSLLFTFHSLFLCIYMFSRGVIRCHFLGLEYVESYQVSLNSAISYTCVYCYSYFVKFYNFLYYWFVQWRIFFIKLFKW